MDGFFRSSQCWGVRYIVCMWVYTYVVDRFVFTAFFCEKEREVILIFGTLYILFDDAFHGFRVNYGTVVSLL